MGFIIVYVTYPNMEEANKIVHHLLKNKLIVCANFFPIKATSNWTGKIMEVNEIISFLKTRKENWKKVKSEIEKLHPYKIPCIIKINVESNKEYEDWIRKETKSF